MKSVFNKNKNYILFIFFVMLCLKTGIAQNMIDKVDEKMKYISDQIKLLQLDNTSCLLYTSLLRYFLDLVDHIL